MSIRQGPAAGPSTGAHQPVDEHIIERLKNMESGIKLRFPNSDRTVAHLWPTATSDSPPPPKHMCYKVGMDQRAMWPSTQHRVPNEQKNEFFVTAPSRIPGAIWLFPPESSTAACATKICQELLGIPHPDAARETIAGKSLDDWMSIARSYWEIANSAYRSCCLEAYLGADLRINCMLAAAELLLTHMEAEGTDTMPARPLLDQEDLENLSIAQYALDEEYPGPDDTATLHIQAQEGQGRGRGGNYTDTLFHLLCVDCDQRFPNYKALRDHERQKKCPNENNARLCNQCNVTLPTREAAKIHYMSVCRRPATPKCPVCGGETPEKAPLETSLTTPCTCAKNAEFFWNSLRDLIASKTNKLLTVERLAALRAVLSLHLTCQLDFARYPNLSGQWWNPKPLGKQAPLMKKADFTAVVDMLPTVSDDGLIHFPDTKQTFTMQQMVEGVKRTTLEPDVVEKSETTSRGDSDMWDPYTTMDKQGIAEFRDIFLAATKEDQIRTYKDALLDVNVLGALMSAHLIDGREDLKTKLFDLNCATAQEQKPFISRPSTPGGAGGPTGGTGPTTTTTHTMTMGAGGMTTPGIGMGVGAGGGTKTKPGPGLGGTGIICGNETHTVPPRFQTENEKLTHLITVHPCPYKLLVNPPCRFYAEFDAEMTKHINTVHVNVNLHTCDLCGLKFPTLPARDAHVSSAHVICVVCRIYFKDHIALASHNIPPCTDIAHLRPPVKTTGTYLTPVAKTDLEVYRQVVPDPSAELASSLSLMASAIPGLPDGVRDDLVKSFAQYGALQKAVTAFEKYPAKARKLKRCLLQAPSFSHEPGSRETLQKAGDFIGKLEIWDPSHRPKDYFNNFLKLQEIVQAITRATAACALTQNSAIALLLQKYSQEALTHLEAVQYSQPCTWSFEQILQTSQDVFFQLDLQDLAASAESAKKHPGEKFHDFFSRIYKLLNTASLGRSEEERLQYISTNMRRLSLREAPFRTKMKIESLESQFCFEYSAQEISDLVRSEEAQKNNQHDDQEVTLLGAYQVSRTQDQNQKRTNNRQRTQTKRVNQVSSPNQGGTSHQGDTQTKWAQQKTNQQPGSNQDNQPTTNQSRWTQRQDQGRYRAPEDGPDPRQNQPKPLFWQHQGPPPTHTPPLGPSLNAKDMYKSSKSARERAEYMANLKKQLGLPETEQMKFCYGCGAGHPKLNGRMGEFHVRGKCNVVDFSDKVHNCPPPISMRLFHDQSQCPALDRKRVANVIRLQSY